MHHLVPLEDLGRREVVHDMDIDIIVWHSQKDGLGAIHPTQGSGLRFAHWTHLKP